MSKKPATHSDAEAVLAEADRDEARALLARRRATRARAELEATVRLLSQQLEATEAQLETALALSDYDPTPIRISPSAAKRGRATVVAVAAASDWHIEERVRPEAVNGANEYTPDIAEERARKFFRGFHRLIDLNRAGATIDQAILWLGGDLLTGYIHEELQEDNWLSPTEATLRLFDVLSGGIDYLLARADLRSLAVVCNHGNHGRTTQRTRISTSARNSYEWLLYHTLRKRYSAERRVVFSIADGRQSYTDVGGFVLRTHHGDDFTYQGGVGGLLIPMRRAVASWQTHRHADATLVGHWHDYHPGPREVVNGSLIGISPYGLARVRAPMQPPCQAFFLVHPERRAIIAHWPIWCA